MDSLELEGKLIQKLPVNTGTSARGAWESQNFVLEIPDGNYTSKAVFKVWGSDKVSELVPLREGMQLKVSFRIASREYNGRWYTDLRAWRVVPVSEAAPAAPAEPAFSTPAGFAPTAPPAAPQTGVDLSKEEDDDLPF